MAFRRVNAGRLSKCLAQGFTASQHCTMHPTSPHKLHTAHCTLNTAHWTMHIPTLHTAHCTQLLPTLQTAHYTLHTLHNCTFPHCTLQTAHCTLHTAHCTLHTTHIAHLPLPTLHTAHWRPQTAPNSPTLHTAPNFSCPFCDCWLEHCVLITEWALSCWCDPLFLFAIHTLNCVIFSVYPLFEQWCSVCVQSVNMSTFCGQIWGRRTRTDVWIL